MVTLKSNKTRCTKWGTTRDNNLKTHHYLTLAHRQRLWSKLVRFSLCVGQRCVYWGWCRGVDVVIGKNVLHINISNRSILEKITRQKHRFWPFWRTFCVWFSTILPLVFCKMQHFAFAKASPSGFFRRPKLVQNLISCSWFSPEVMFLNTQNAPAFLQNAAKRLAKCMS